MEMALSKYRQGRHVLLEAEHQHTSGTLTKFVMVSGDVPYPT